MRNREEDFVMNDSQPTRIGNRRGNRSGNRRGNYKGNCKGSQGQGAVQCL